ncbi:MAG TPA: hypothetical protein VGM07_12380 [Stellaceae bacterium]
MQRAASLLLLLSVLFSGALRAPVANLFQPSAWGVAIAAAQTTVVNSITITNQSGAAISNYPFQFGRPFIAGAIADQPQVLIDGAPVPTQADVKNRYADGSVAFAVVAVVIPAIPASGSLTLTFQNQASAVNTPLTTAQMLDQSYDFVALATLKSTTGVTEVASARLMLQNGDYKLWTAGPIAQTIILADDTPSRKYDIGFGDGYHPLRPRFYATFWPATHQVWVRVVIENGLTTELEDMAYTATVRIGAVSPGGSGAPPASYVANLTGNPQEHWAMSTWTQSFWQGGTPSPQVNIDNNLAYLESTRFMPNYDPSIALNPASLAAEYSIYWSNIAHDIYEGGWTMGMSTGGARQDIGPQPTWDALWLYTGDWRMRQLALGMADLAAAWPVNLRESDPTKRLNRADPVPSSGQIGSGYGLPVSITDRKTLGPSAGGEGVLLYYGYTAAVDALKVVGPLCLIPDTAWNCSGWAYDAAHEPAPFFIPYVLTGDPFYLGEMEMWAAYDATTSDGTETANAQGRGPTGAEGGAYDQLRGAGWILRSRAETAFAIPDGDPFKTYLTILTQEEIARWEGCLGVADPVLTGYPEYVWAQETGDPLSSTAFGTPPPAPALHNWATNYDAGYVSGGVWNDAAVNAYSETWMQWYVQYALGRAAELGFAAGPLALSSGQYLIGMVNSTGYPMLIGSYVTPTWTTSGQISSWPQFVALFTPQFLTGNGWSGFGSSVQGPITTFFFNQLYSQGYDMYAAAALATLVDDGAPGAAQAETWVGANVYQPLVANGSLEADPSWAIVPRTDENTLPPRPTSPP